MWVQLVERAEQNIKEAIERASDARRCFSVGPCNSCFAGRLFRPRRRVAFRPRGGSFMRTRELRRIEVGIWVH